MVVRNVMLEIETREIKKKIKALQEEVRRGRPRGRQESREVMEVMSEVSSEDEALGKAEEQAGRGPEKIARPAEKKQVSAVQDKRKSTLSVAAVVGGQ